MVYRLVVLKNNSFWTKYKIFINKIQISGILFINVLFFCQKNNGKLSSLTLKTKQHKLIQLL